MVLVAAATLLAVACGGDEPPTMEPSAGPEGPVDPETETETTGEPDPSEEPADDGQADDGQAAPGGLRSASIRDPLRSRSDNFQESEFSDGAASTAFVDDSYRMVSPGGPLISPLQDESMAQTVEVDVQVTVNGITTPGFAGVACGIGEEGAYLFTAGIDEDGEPFWAIGYLDPAVGGPTSMRDANLDDTPSGADVVPDDGGPFTIGGRCERGTGDQPIVLSMTVDDVEIARVGGDEIIPLEGQVGLFALGQSEEPLEVTFNDFLASGTPDGVDD